jgi:PKD repeat protein
MNENKNKVKIKLTKIFTAPLLVLASIILMVGCTDLGKIPPTGKPLVSITADKTYGEAPLNVSFTVTAIPARGSIKKLVIDYGDGSSEDLTQKLKGDTISVSHEFKAIGVFTVRVAAMDENDNSQSEVQIITNDRPIISNLKAYSDSAYTKEATDFMPNTPVYIKALCMDTDGIRATIDWGDGTVEPSFECSGSHLYSKEGEYTIKVMVQDYAPQPLTNVASITVKVRYGIPPTNNPPELDIRLLNASGEAPLTVTLYVGAIDVDGQVAEVKVDWGDGKYETLGDGDKIGERDGRKLYKKEHTYTSQGIFTVTVIVKDDKGETPTPLPTRTVTVLSSSSRPILSVKFKDHTSADPNGKTYNIDMTAYTDQVTISADILSYDITKYDIIGVIRRNYVDGSTRIIIGKIYSSPTFGGIFYNPNYTDPTGYLKISPDDINDSPKGFYTSGITVDYTVTIYAVESGMVSVWGWLGCSSHLPDPPYNSSLSGCENIINTIKGHPSANSIETKFTVKPK